MTNIANKFLKPNKDDQYFAQQSQVFYGLWTPYGIVCPLFMGVWPDGSVTITYNTHKDAQFTRTQKQKLKYVKERGVDVQVTHINAEGVNE